MNCLVDLFEELHIPFMETGHHHCRPGWIQIDCPFCSPDWQRWRLGCNVASLFTHCWSCGFHSLHSVVFALTQNDKRTRTLISSLRDSKAPPHKIRTTIQTAGKVTFPQRLGPLTNAHKRYLTTTRGYHLDEIKELWGIEQGIGISTKLSWRVLIPIHFNHEVVSWTTRSIGENVKTKYISARPDQEKYHHKDLLYGEQYCLDAIIVHEGPLDVWRTGPGAVATFGTSITQSQINRIAKYNRRIICFDNEPDAQRRATELTNNLSCLPGETIQVFLDSKDAGSASKKEIENLRKLLIF